MPNITASTDQLRQHEQPLLDALADAGADVSKPRAMRCPFHPDDHASAGIYERDGVWRFKCQACGEGGDVFDIRAKVSGRSVEDELRAARPDQPRQRPQRAHTPRTFATACEAVAALERQHGPRSAAWTYTSAAGDPVGVVARWDTAEGKQIRPVSRNADGAWRIGGMAEPRPLYRLPEVIQADRVVVVEGEKAAEALHSISIAATTSPHGSKSADKTDWSPLAGKAVYLWPDADPPNSRGERPGIAFMRQVAKLLDALEPAPSVHWLDPDSLDLAPKGDAADLVERYADVDPEQARGAIERDILAEAEPLGPSSEVSSMIGDAIAGRRFTVPWPWPTLGNLSRALAPATVTLLVAGPGATKSLALLEATAWWYEQGYRISLLELEDGRAFHLRRALAQRAAKANLTDDDWCHEHPETAQGAAAQHADFIDGFGRVVHELPGDEQPTMQTVGDWIEQQALAGKRVVAVDPLSIVQQQHEQWRADQQFTARVKRIAEQTGCSIIIVMHPRKGSQGGQTTDDIANGAAFGRLAQTVLWLESWPEPRDVTVRDGTMSLNIEDEANRVIRITKARNGRGQGLRIAYMFDPETLRMRERGVIVKRGSSDE